MTISKVLLAAALLVLGFMILGIQKNMMGINDSVSAGRGEVVKHLTDISGKLDVTHGKLDTLSSKLTRGVGRIGKPRVKPVPHLRRLPPPVSPADPFARWFMTPPSQG